MVTLASPEMCLTSSKSQVQISKSSTSNGGGERQAGFPPHVASWRPLARVAPVWWLSMASPCSLSSGQGRNGLSILSIATLHAALEQTLLKPVF